MSFDPNETTPYEATPDPLAFDRGAPPRQPRRPRPAWLWQVALGLGGCLLMLAVGLPVIAWIIHREAEAIRPSEPAAHVKDPYPQCAEIRRWLKEHTGAPDKLEIVRWGEKKIDRGEIVIEVRYRGQTRSGGPASQTSGFVFSRGGRLLRTDALQTPGGDLFDPPPAPGVITTIDPIPRMGR